jgi:hypothetical protein
MFNYPKITNWKSVFICCRTNATFWALRNLTASNNNEHAVSSVRMRWRHIAHLLGVATWHMPKPCATCSLGMHCLRMSWRAMVVWRYSSPYSELQYQMGCTLMVCYHDLPTNNSYNSIFMLPFRFKKRHSALEGTGLRFTARQQIFLSSKMPSSILGLTQPPVQRVLGVERPERDTDHSPQRSNDATSLSPCVTSLWAPEGLLTRTSTA